MREASGGGVDYAIEATGRAEAMETAFLSTRTRGAAVLIGIPRAGRGAVPCPARRSRAWSAAILGSIYGSAKPERDFPDTLDVYRSGRLPLDRLISHRLPARARSTEAFELMHVGRGAAGRWLDTTGGAS